MLEQREQRALAGVERDEVEVIEDALVIDVFNPVRQDWIDKTDTYFKR